MKETDRIVKETAEQMKETDRIVKETAEQMKETDRRIEKMSADSDRRFEQRIGKLTDRIGEIVENMVGGSIIEQFRNNHDYDVTEISRNIKFGKGTAFAGEIDVLLARIIHTPIFFIASQFRQRFRGRRGFFWQSAHTPPFPHPR
jgi:hypothetical protein